MITWGRRGATAIAGLVLMVAVLAGSAGAAWAGGPTSVIMVSPGAGRAAALHIDDGRYEQLVAAVRAYHPATGSTSRPAGVTACSDCEIRLTWLIHDMQIWRIDRVHLTPRDGMWLETVADEEGRGDLLERPAVWHRPADPAALAGLLRGVGLAPPVGDDSVAVPSARDDSGGAAADTSDGPTPVVGAVTGVGIGMAAGLAIGWWVGRRAVRDGAVLTG